MPGDDVTAERERREERSSRPQPHPEARRLAGVGQFL